MDKSGKIFDTINNDNIKGFSTIQKEPCTQKGKKVTQSVYKRMVDITKARGILMESVLPYDV